MNNYEINNCLVVIENGILNTYSLDDKLVWEVGRISKDNIPDIKFSSLAISRRHGKFQNMDGMWLYVDRNGKNGTVLNGQYIVPGLGGRLKSIILKHGDIFVFGGNGDQIIDNKTVWAMFLTHQFDERWRTEDTKGYKKITFRERLDSVSMDSPKKGLVVHGEEGIAIYMGDLTYLNGNISISGK